MCSVMSDPMPAEVDEAQNHIQPVLVPETNQLA